MEPRMTLDTVLTIISIVMGLAVQSWGVWKWLSGEFAKRDAAINVAVHERNQVVTAIRAESNAAREHMRTEISRIDRDISGVRAEVRERLATLPTRQEQETMLRERVAPLESDLRSLVIELARLGVHNPANGSRQA